MTILLILLRGRKNPCEDHMQQVGLSLRQVSEFVHLLGQWPLALPFVN